MRCRGRREEPRKLWARARISRRIIGKIKGAAVGCCIHGRNACREAIVESLKRRTRRTHPRVYLSTGRAMRRQQRLFRQ